MVTWILILTAMYGPLGPDTAIHKFRSETACITVGEEWAKQTAGARNAQWSCVAVEEAAVMVPVSIPSVGLVWFELPPGE